MAVFRFIDEVVEFKKAESLEVFFTLKGDEEFLKDHFSGFPVMPGVLLVESLKQAAVLFLERSQSARGPVVAWRLRRLGGMKFGQFVKPGTRLKIFVKPSGPLSGASEVRFEGRVEIFPQGEKNGPQTQARVLGADFSLEKFY